MVFFWFNRKVIRCTITLRKGEPNRQSKVPSHWLRLYYIEPKMEKRREWNWKARPFLACQVITDLLVKDGRLTKFFWWFTVIQVYTITYSRSHKNFWHKFTHFLSTISFHSNATKIAYVYEWSSCQKVWVNTCQKSFNEIYPWTWAVGSVSSILPFKETLFLRKSG